MARPPVPSNMAVVSLPGGAAACRIDLLDGDREVCGYAWVDAEDAELVKGFRWYRNSGYVERAVHARIAKGKYSKRHVMLHRHLLGLDGVAGIEIDHIDGDPLNNRRSNLRVVTHAQNMQNRRKQSGTSSRYRGVHWNSQRSKWRAGLRVDGRFVDLGHFADEDEAGAVARKARAELHTHATN
jgi:hypothetical protein